MSSKTLLVDGNNLLVRCVMAMAYRPGRQVLSSHGVPTGPLVAFINTLARHVREEAPDKLVVCWDGGKSAYRLGIYPDYKGNRSRNTDEIVEDTLAPEDKDMAEGSFDLAKTFLSLSGIYHVERRGVEADDLIAWYVLNRRPEEQIAILSNDKDFLQLISEYVIQIRVSNADTPTERWDVRRVEEVYRMHPRYLARMMALTGDAGDNVPGVPRIGPKTATKLLREADFDLNRVLEHPRIREHREVVQRNLLLVDLSSLPMTLSLGRLPRFEPTQLDSVLYPELLDFLARYELRSVAGRVTRNALWSQGSTEGDRFD